MGQASVYFLFSEMKCCNRDTCRGRPETNARSKQRVGGVSARD